MFRKVALTLFFVMAVINACGPAPAPKLSNVSATTLPLTGNVGETKTATVTFANTGNAVLSYTASLTSSEALELTGTKQGTVEAGATGSITLEATCLNTTPANGTLTLDSTGGKATVNVALTCTAPPTSGSYNIDVRFVGTSTTRQQKAAFEQAALRWEAVITSEFANISVSTLPKGPYCDNTEPNISTETIDDLLIFAKVGTIDGQGNTLAQAGPLGGRTAGGSFLGCMIFDIADIDSLTKGGSFADVVLHEMGHVLGIGTFWEPSQINTFDLLDYAPASSSGCGGVNTFTIKPGFTGQNAIDNALGAVYDDSGFVPVEDEFGDGTRCGHWDEGVFDNELMTGFIEAPGVTMSLSRLTIGSLEDIGYKVDYNGAADYALPNCLPNCKPLKDSGDIDELFLAEQLIYPIFMVDPQGNIQQLNRQ
jgi:Leishmanolysin